MSSYLIEDARLIQSLLSEDIKPPERSEHLFLIYAVLMRAKGEQVTAADVHDAWAAWMQMTERNHAALVPFSELDADVQNEDLPYVEAIHRAARLRGSK